LSEPQITYATSEISNDDQFVTLSPYATGEARARSESFVPVFPDIMENHTMEFRVVVLGNIKVNEKDLGNPVGAYIDMVMEP